MLKYLHIFGESFDMLKSLGLQSTRSHTVIKHECLISKRESR